MSLAEERIREVLMNEIKLKARITELEQQLENERIRLAACSVAALGYFEGCKDEYKSASLDDVLRLLERADLFERQQAVLVDALSKIEKWFGEFPPTGKTWATGEEMSYLAAYGSNGERDFMRSVAREALAAVRPATMINGLTEAETSASAFRCWNTYSAISGSGSHN